MIVKVQHFKDNIIGVYEEEIYSNVENIYRSRDSVDNEFLHLKTKDNDELIIIPITTLDENGNHPALVGAIWLMNNEGKTIEKLV